MEIAAIARQLKTHTSNRPLVVDGVTVVAGVGVNVSLPGVSGQNIAYTYDAAGQLTTITDSGITQVTTYQHDNAGNRTREFTSQGGTVRQNNTLTYDQMGRTKTLSTQDGQKLSFEYDAAGNRTRQITEGNNLPVGVQGPVQIQAAIDESGNPVYTSTTGSTVAYTATRQDLWYAYDSMNRQILNGGVNNNTDLSTANINAAQGHLVTYDKNGNRTSVTSCMREL